MKRLAEFYPVAPFASARYRLILATGSQLWSPRVASLSEA